MPIKEIPVSLSCGAYWTNAAVECHLNGYDCKNCNVKKILETPCKMKRTVFALIEKYGVKSLHDAVLRYKKNQELTEDEATKRNETSLQLIHNSILKGNLTPENISKDTGLTRRTIICYLPFLYKKKGFPFNMQDKINDKILAFSRFLEETGAKPYEILKLKGGKKAAEKIVNSIKSGHLTPWDIKEDTGLRLCTILSKLAYIFPKYGVNKNTFKDKNARIKALYEILKD